MTSHHTTLELKIRGMDCSSCAGHLESVAKEISGVTKVTMLLADRKAVVLFDPAKNTATAICEIIEAAGYAIVVEGDEKTVETESAKQPMPPVPQAGRQDTHQGMARCHARPDAGRCYTGQVGTQCL